MTTKLSCKYVKGTEHVGPRVQIALHVPTLTLLKLLFLSIFNHQTITYDMPEEDIETVSKVIARWRIVKHFREQYKKYKDSKTT